MCIFAVAKLPLLLGPLRRARKFEVCFKAIDYIQSQKCTNGGGYRLITRNIVSNVFDLFSIKEKQLR